MKGCYLISMMRGNLALFTDRTHQGEGISLIMSVAAQCTGLDLLLESDPRNRADERPCYSVGVSLQQSSSHAHQAPYPLQSSCDCSICLM